MTPDSKALERKLDRDFLHYLSLTKTLSENIKSEEEKSLCEAWLKQLCGKCVTTTSGKRVRNIYLSRLLLQMQDGKLKDIFLTAPPSGDFESPYTVFGLPLEVEDIKGFEEKGFQLDSDAAEGSGDFSETSRDGRIYIATRQVKNGMMAFLAVANTENEPLWIPQQFRQNKQEATEDGSDSKAMTQGHLKRQPQFECVSLSEMRTKPEEREKVYEWIDKIIDDCHKWLRGEDPHNMDLETLFELLYQYYQEDPEKAEILQYPKDVRNVLMSDIRQKILDTRAEIKRREVILDQYEADEYVEGKLSAEKLNEVWHQSTNRPMKEHIRKELERIYPVEVVERFFELLVEQRVSIIARAERDANKKIAEIRNSSREELKRERQKIEKVAQDYNEYYCIYKEAEKYKAEYQNYMKESGSEKGEKSLKKQEIMKIKNKLEGETAIYRRRYEKERKTQGEMVEQLEEVKEFYGRLKNDQKVEEEKSRSEIQKLIQKRCLLKESIENQKKKLCEIKNQLEMKKQSSSSHCKQ